MTVAASLLASALMTIGAAAASGAPDLMPAFPDSMDRQVISRWLVSAAGFPAGAPADIGLQSAVLIETDSTAELRQGLHAVRFREEALSVDSSPAPAAGRSPGRPRSTATKAWCAPAP